MHICIGKIRHIYGTYSYKGWNVGGYRQRAVRKNF